VDFKIGEEVISFHMPLTIILRMGREMDLGGCTVEMNQTKNIVRFRWTECMKEGFMYTLCDDSSVYLYRGFKVPYREARLTT
jgi:hypothetical protein